MFRDNLKEQIEYKGYIIKELAAKTGISKKTIDTYVGTSACIPAADVAVKLAKALDTTVEYLVTGNGVDEKLKEEHNSDEDVLLYHKYRKTLLKIESLSERDKKLLFSLLESMQKES